jgi:hypothetical protein
MVGEMGMKKFHSIAICLLTLFILSGCSTAKSGQQSYSGLKTKLASKSSSAANSRSAKASSEKTSLHTRNNANSQSESENTSTQLWNPQKSTELAAFMKKWGATMSQTYQAYTPEHKVNFYGDQEPGSQDFIGVNEQKIAVTWSSDGQTEQGRLALVAAYSDAETAAYGDQHLYYFAIYNKQPVVLITMQNQAMPNNLLNFTKTQNRDVAQGFAGIVNN